MPLAVPLILCLLILTVHPIIELKTDDWVRLALIYLFYLLYISVFFSLGLFISTRNTRASNSLLILLFLWVTFVTIIPKLSIMIVGHLKKVPSIHEISAEKEAFLQQIQGKIPDLIQNWTKEHENLRFVNNGEYALKYKKFLEELQNDLTSQIDKKNNTIEEHYQSLLKDQRKTAMNLSKVSPASALLSGTMRLARTGMYEHDRLLNSIKSYKPIFTQWINSEMMSTVGLTVNQDIDITGIPKHKYASEHLTDSVRGVFPDLVILVMMSITFFVSASVSFLKYEV
jgi:ABC-type transport system involved in multi-copper enzyme maturation permease subunit